MTLPLRGSSEIPVTPEEDAAFAERAAPPLRLASHHNGHMLIVEVRAPGVAGAPFLIETRDGELELTEQLLEWLCTVSGPAALHARRRAFREAHAA